MNIKEIFKQLSTWTVNQKLQYNEILLSEITIMNRAIWDDPDSSDSEKVECLKWSNELVHRIWNINFALKRGQDDNSEINLLNDVLLYKNQSPELGNHLGSTIVSAFNRYKYLMQYNRNHSSLTGKDIIQYNLSAAGNVEAPGYKLLKDNGFKVYKANNYWIAESKTLKLNADSTLELLGLAYLYTQKGRDWRVNDDVIDEFLEQDKK